MEHVRESEIQEKLFSPPYEPHHLYIILIIKRHVCLINDSSIFIQP
jgi:hypothetical protein